MLFADLGYCKGCYRNYYRDYCGSSYRGCWWVRISFIDLACCAGCLGAVGVRGDVSALEWDGAYVDKAYADRACVDKACTDGACSYLLLKFP